MESNTRTCRFCGVDISELSPKAMRCKECQRKNVKRVPRSHKPTPQSCIRAITPVASELGMATNKRREDRVRDPIPSPVLADYKTVTRVDKKTWVFSNK